MDDVQAESGLLQAEHELTFLSDGAVDKRRLDRPLGRLVLGCRKLLLDVRVPFPGHPLAVEEPVVCLQ